MLALHWQLTHPHTHTQRPDYISSFFILLSFHIKLHSLAMSSTAQKLPEAVSLKSYLVSKDIFLFIIPVDESVTTWMLNHLTVPSTWIASTAPHQLGGWTAEDSQAPPRP